MDNRIELSNSDLEKVIGGMANPVSGLSNEEANVSTPSYQSAGINQSPCCPTPSGNIQNCDNSMPSDGSSSDNANPNIGGICG